MLAEVGLRRETARHLLNAGIAGKPFVTSVAHLYHADRVRAVVERAALDAEGVPWVATETFVGRVGPRTPDPGPGRSWRGADLTAPLGEQLDAVRQWWELSAWTQVLVASCRSSPRSAESCSSAARSLA